MLIISPKRINVSFDNFCTSLCLLHEQRVRKSFLVLHPILFFYSYLDAINLQFCARVSETKSGTGGDYCNQLILNYSICNQWVLNCSILKLWAGFFVTGCAPLSPQVILLPTLTCGHSLTKSKYCLIMEVQNFEQP
jgi:hypothetical protein